MIHSAVGEVQTHIGAVLVTILEIPLFVLSHAARGQAREEGRKEGGTAARGGRRGTGGAHPASGRRRCAHLAGHGAYGVVVGKAPWACVSAPGCVAFSNMDGRCASASPLLGWLEQQQHVQLNNNNKSTTGALRVFGYCVLCSRFLVLKQIDLKVVCTRLVGIHDGLLRYSTLGPW